MNDADEPAPARNTGGAVPRRRTPDGGETRRVDYLPELERMARHHWDACVIRHLTGGPRRFGQLAAAIREGAPSFADSALTQSLRRLHHTDMIVCRDDGTGPHLWALTESGRTQAHRLNALLQALADIDAGTVATAAGT